MSSINSTTVTPNYNNCNELLCDEDFYEVSLKSFQKFVRHFKIINILVIFVKIYLSLYTLKYNK